MKLKKIVAASAAAAMLALSMGVFVGCGESDEDVIREALTTELESIKNQDATYMSEMAADMDADEFAAYGIDPQEFMSKYLTGFDYTIDSITVDGDTAQAVVTLTCKSFSAYQDALSAATDDVVANTDLSSMSSDDLNLLVGQIMMDALDQVEPVATDAITIEYTKTDNTWTPTTASEQAITNAMLTN